MNRDKRTVSGRRRYARRVGDHVVLLAACDGNLNAKWRCARGAGAVCSSCGGAVLDPKEAPVKVVLKNRTLPPG